MSKVMTFSRYFPAYHPRKGEPTYFVEGIWESIRNNQNIDSPQYHYMKFESDIMRWKQYQPKHHTIRAGNRWKVGDKFSPRVWSGKPYNSKQIIIAPDIEIKKVWDFEIQIDPFLLLVESAYVLRINDNYISEENTFSTIKKIAKNDGLSTEDFITWFIKRPKVEVFSGQIICWNETITY